MIDQTPEAWEQVRRSVAMLSPGAWAFRREQALEALSALIAVLHEQQDTEAVLHAAEPDD